MFRIPGSSFRTGRTYRRLAALAALASAAVSVAVVQAAPASAYGGTIVYPAQCEPNYQGELRCYRPSESWDSNSTYENRNVLGSVGATQRMNVTFTVTPRGGLYNTPTNLQTSSYVYDNRTNITPQRIRLSQTYKAFGAGGAQIGVNWGVISYNPNDTQISAGTVYFNMTRSNLKSMSSQTSLAFPYDQYVSAVEQVSSSTLEYASSNIAYRLLTKVPLSNLY